MNPFFWVLVLLATVVLWFVLRGVFVALGSWFKNTMNDTKAILEDDGDDSENEGDENNA